MSISYIANYCFRSASYFMLIEILCGFLSFVNYLKIDNFIINIAKNGMALSKFEDNIRMLSL